MEKREVYRQVARLHLENINQGFLATLGEGFLALMYRAIDESSASVLLVDVEDDRVVGFVSGGRGMGPIYRRMLRSPVELGMTLLPSLVRPGRLWRIAEILRYSGRGGDSTGQLPAAELLSIAMDPAWRGGERAARLYRRLEGYFRDHGDAAFKITVGAALAPAHRFYRRMGAMPACTIEVHAGEPSTVYVHAL